MLEQIKSKYVLKIILSNISEEIKFKLLKYNNKLKDKLNINIFNYKLFSGKYIIGKRNGKVKEFDSFDDKLIYEGEYIEGKRYGYGKEYYKNNKIKFEGKYLNGRRNGKGREYYENGNLKFEGIYFFGKKYKGKGYNHYSNVIYELEDGKGIIKEVDDIVDFITFEGEYPSGKGKEYFSKTKIKFEGEYKNGIKWNGIGYEPFNNKIYEIKNGKGYIKEYNFLQTLIFEGEYLNGKRDGKGKEFINGFLSFEGEYINGKRNGKGKEYKYQGKEILFEGDYLYNSKIKGKEYYLNGKLEFEGEYLFNKKWNGKGYDKNGNIIYELNNGNGKVKEYYNGLLIFDGFYLNGKKNGKGKQFYKNGELMFEGEFSDDKYWNGFLKKYLYLYQKAYLKKEIEYTKGVELKKIVRDYNDDGKLLFEGEFFKSKSLSKGKEYNKYGEIIYEGEYLDGERWNGIIKQYDCCKNPIFIGNISQGKKNGKAEEYDTKGNLIFEGEYLNGKRWNGKYKKYDAKKNTFIKYEYLNGKLFKE